MISVTHHDQLVPNSTSDWSALPKELFTIITKDSVLGPDDLKAMRLVNRHWQSGIDQELTDLTVEDIKDISKMSKFPRLKTLNIFGGGKSKIGKMALLILWFSRHILGNQKLTLHQTEVDLAKFKYHALNGVKISQKHFEVLKNSRNLRHLHLEQISDLMGQTLESVLLLEQLRSLTICNCPNVALPSLRNIGQLTNLQTLKIQFPRDPLIGDELGLPLSVPQQRLRDAQIRKAERELSSISQLKELRDLEINEYASVAIALLSNCEQNSITKVKIDWLKPNMVAQLSKWPKLEKLVVERPLWSEVIPLLGQLSQVRSFNFYGVMDQCNYDIFSRLIQMKSLREIETKEVNLNHENLGLLTQLTSIKISNLIVTERGVITRNRGISELLHLRNLTIENEFISKSEMISSLTQIKSLELNNAVLTKGAIEGLSSLAHLESLSLRNARVPENFDLTHLPILDHLTTLRIDLVNKSDRSFFIDPDVDTLMDSETMSSSSSDSMAPFTQLADVTLSGFPLDKKQADLINSLPVLKRLDLSRAEVSKQIVDALARKKPKLMILAPNSNAKSQNRHRGSLFGRLANRIKALVYWLFNKITKRGR